MKVVSISNSPTVCDGDGSIRGDVTDLNKILDNIDQAEGRNDAIRVYIYALRDLQRAHNRFAFDGNDNTDEAQAAVAAAFDRLIEAEFSLNRSRLSHGR